MGLSHPENTGNIASKKVKGKKDVLGWTMRTNHFRDSLVLTGLSAFPSLVCGS